MIPVKTSNVFFPNLFGEASQRKAQLMKEDVQHPPWGHSNAWQAFTSRPFQDLCKIYQRSATSLHFSDTLWKWMNMRMDNLKVINSKGFPFLYGVHGEVLCSFLWWTEHMYYTVYNIKGMGLEHQDNSNLRWHMSIQFLPPEVYEQLRLFKSHCLRRSSAHISQYKKIKSSKIYLQNTVIRVQESWPQVEKEQSCKQTSCNKNDSWSLVVPHPCLLFHVCFKGQSVHGELHCLWVGCERDCTCETFRGMTKGCKEPMWWSMICMNTRYKCVERYKCV